MRLRHELNGVGDVLTGREGIAHAGVSHGDAVADADGAELERDAAGQVYPFFDKLGEITQMKVTGNDLVPGIGDADKRPFEILVSHAQGVQEGPLGGARHPPRYLLAP